MVKWRRKTKSEYNEVLGYFVPIPEEIRRENFILLHVKGSELAEKYFHNKLEDQVTAIKQHFPSMKIIYVIEGLQAFFKKINIQAQRAYNSRVRKKPWQVIVPYLH